tara:strand:- start:502 stop:900 length:399 start_codon:yes stop_codon:yes gene_type:complete
VLSEVIVAATRTTRLMVVFAASVASLLLMMITVDPEVQYSVDEVMDDPTRLERSEVFVRGEVSSESLFSGDNLFILNGTSSSIFVDFTNARIPDGFDGGRTIAVRGLLVFENGNWIIESTEIQTGCPSKYES